MRVAGMMVARCDTAKYHERYSSERKALILLGWADGRLDLTPGTGSTVRAAWFPT